MNEPVRIGVIGGSGLYRMDQLEILEERHLETPFGHPSGPYVIGRIGDHTVAFLARHGPGHRWMPTEINYRANIMGFKMLGVEWLFSISAVGSMKEDLKPGDMVIPTQFIDRTRLRERTFFGRGLVAHVAMADPVCPELSRVVYEVARDQGIRVHHGGVYICIEGPQFSTRAESHLYRQWGVDVIGMTNLPEAWLAREAEICYTTMAMVTDYDCWYEGEEEVNVEMVLQRLRDNIEKAQRVLRAAVPRLPLPRSCPCARALENTFLTDPETVPDEAWHRLRPLVARYFPGK